MPVRSSSSGDSARYRKGEVLEKLYYFCAVFGSLFVVMQFFLSLFTGVGADNDVSDVGDLDSDHSGIDFLRVLSVRTVTAGLAFFGLAGMAGVKSNSGGWITFIIAFCSGLLALFLVYFLYRLISSLRSDGAVTAETLPGSEGNVYVRIPPKRSAPGKVIVNHQGRSMEYEAFSDADQELKAGEPVVVKEILAPNQVLVESSRSR